MRRNRVSLSIWNAYRIQTVLPRNEGPAPPEAPQNMNGTKAVQLHDPIDDPFPIKIRGSEPRPDVPTDQFVDQTFIMNATTPMFHELKPWSTTAPENAFRFRPHNEFDSTGRKLVKQLREDTRHISTFRDAYLSKMKGETRRRAPSSATLMDRAVREHHRHVGHVHAADKQRDAGRVTAPLPKVEVAADDPFPYTWHAEDWYEYEVAKVRTKRFVYENGAGNTEGSSEVTYKLMVGSVWEHHLAPLTDDLTAFIRDVARQIIEEKLVSVRALLSSFDTRGASIVDSEMRAAFSLGANSYDDEEIAQFAKRELLDLERECVRVMSLIASTKADFTDMSDPNAAWPVVETMEPWRRMVEFWHASEDGVYQQAEKSTRKYEFRRYFRVIRIKMPFQSHDLERRLYDVRHWLHRQATIEFHTVHKKNIVHDAARFPVEHDPEVLPTTADHGMYSFALDWAQAPADYVRTVRGQKGDTMATIAQRLGCSEKDLRAANPTVRGSVSGHSLVVPKTATKRQLTLPHGAPKTVPRDAAVKTWEQAAKRLHLTVEELQVANPAAVLSYADGAFAETVTAFTLPFDSRTETTEEFAATEKTLLTDTFESLAARLGTTVESLRASNPEVKNPSDVDAIRVPRDAKRMRRTHHPLSRADAETAELFPTLVGEGTTRQLPPEFPSGPEVAAQFPDEFTTERYPRQPLETPGVESWLTYTARYLDRNLSVQNEPTSSYKTNPAWPAQPAPGTAQQTPFEEDQTWLLHRIPTQRHEMFNPDQHLQDSSNVNHELFAHSMDRLAP
jgi:murein DD-endopeptidase MepM/ murein hydrolase activator NlpD